MSAFCAAYARATARGSWAASTAVGLLACATVTLLGSALPQRLALAAFITFPALVALIALIGRRPPGRTSRRLPWWDIPARMLLATMMVLLITGAARFLGPTWSGLFSTLPVYALVMGVFSHRHDGAAAASGFLRGVSVGAIGAAAFLLVVGALVQHASLAVTYLSASAASLAAAGLAQLVSTTLAREATAAGAGSPAPERATWPCGRRRLSRPSPRRGGLLSRQAGVSAMSVGNDAAVSAKSQG